MNLLRQTDERSAFDKTIWFRFQFLLGKKRVCEHVHRDQQRPNVSRVKPNATNVDVAVSFRKDVNQSLQPVSLTPTAAVTDIIVSMILAALTMSKEKNDITPTTEQPTRPEMPIWTNKNRLRASSFNLVAMLSAGSSCDDGKRCCWSSTAER